MDTTKLSKILKMQKIQKMHELQKNFQSKIRKKMQKNKQ